MSEEEEEEEEEEGLNLKFKFLFLNIKSIWAVETEILCSQNYWERP